jgi:hypothetical protein
MRSWLKGYRVHLKNAIAFQVFEAALIDENQKDIDLLHVPLKALLHSPESNCHRLKN